MLHVSILLNKYISLHGKNMINKKSINSRKHENMLSINKWKICESMADISKLLPMLNFFL